MLHDLGKTTKKIPCQKLLATTNLDAFKKKTWKKLSAKCLEPKIVVKKMMIYPWYNGRKKDHLDAPKKQIQVKF